MDFLYQLFNLVKRWSSYFGLTNKQNQEDLFYRLLYDKNYDEALKLAKQYTYLDPDVVYKLKWRDGGITVQSINTVLGNMQDKLWAINQCVKTVPISYEACRSLIEFGLREANLRLLYQLGNELASSQKQLQAGKYEAKFGRFISPKKDVALELSDDMTDEQIEGLIDFDNLNDQQRELCRNRHDLLRHEHSLFAYESTLGDYRTVQQHFDHVFYDEFRRKCPLNACIDYAHDGDARAIEVMMNFYTDQLMPHYLAILSNIPETLSPYQYRNLLPCLRENDDIYEWRVLSGKIQQEEFDWSSRNKDASCTSLSLNLKTLTETYETEFYASEEHLCKYRNPLTSELLSEWYQERALDMECRTSLVSTGIQLLHLGSDLNIKNLSTLHENFTEFGRIVYDCCADDDNHMYLSYKEFNNWPLIERLVFMTGTSTKNCKDRFRFYVIPYMQKRDSQMGPNGKANMLIEYFTRLAHSRENVCRSIYNDLLDRIESDKLVASWTQNLDDTLDEIGVTIKTIERDRQAKQLSTVASQTMALGDLQASYEACKMLMQKDYTEYWALCCQLGMNKQLTDNQAKYKLLAFALAHCDDPDGNMSAKILNHVIELRKRDQKIQMAYLERNL